MFAEKALGTLLRKLSVARKPVGRTKLRRHRLRSLLPPHRCKQVRPFLPPSVPFVMDETRPAARIGAVAAYAVPQAPQEWPCRFPRDGHCKIGYGADGNRQTGLSRRIRDRTDRFFRLVPFLV